MKVRRYGENSGKKFAGQNLSVMRRHLRAQLRLFMVSVGILVVGASMILRLAKMARIGIFLFSLLLDLFCNFAYKMDFFKVARVVIMQLK